MKTPEQIVKGGLALKAIRESLGLPMREVERMSKIVARKKNYIEYYVSHSYLCHLESGSIYPNLLKLYSLCLIYKRHLDELFSLFGFSMQEAAVDQMLIGLPNTTLLQPSSLDITQEINAPLRLEEKASFEQTNLVSRMFESWGKVPVALLERMDLRKSLYGFVGTRDNTLFPLIRPGSFVEIDSRQRKIATSWKDEFHRPIYFVELRDQYVCSWCDLHQGQLLLVPTPQSGLRARPVRYPGDADIVGRVTAVTMRIADALGA